MMVLLLKVHIFFQLVELKARVNNNGIICFKAVAILESEVNSIIEIINY